MSMIKFIPSPELKRYMTPGIVPMVVTRKEHVSFFGGLGKGFGQGVGIGLGLLVFGAGFVLLKGKRIG